jgi:hypothetical protein
MNILSDSLTKLFELLEESGLLPPVSEVRLVEIDRPAAIDKRGRLIISRDTLQVPSEYASRFESLTHSGLPCVNMSCYGVYNGFLIVGIELPDYVLSEENIHRGTSVNYSGPQRSVLQNGWDASVMMVLV